MTRIVFADEKLKKAFDKLRDSAAEKRLYESLIRAFKDIKEAPAAFIHIRQSLFRKNT